MYKKVIPYKPNIHFIGIGGIGVSALARYFLAQRYNVSGSDVYASEITNQLKKDGIEIHIGHNAKNISSSIHLIIYSAAIQKDNCELEMARRLNIPIKSYSETLGDLTRKYKTIAISGAHGKSTTTAMSSLVLIKAGFDPSVIIGTKLKEFNDTNFKNGKSDCLVIEADEYHRSFLNYSPFAAIITNIDREHLDYYKNLAVIKNTFLKFIKNIRVGGILVVNKDDKNLYNLRNKIQKIAEQSHLKLFWHGTRVNPRLNQHLFSLLKIPGKHNISNALAVYTLAKALGIKNNVIFNALSKYTGAWRRMEYRGNLILSRKYKVSSRNKKAKSKLTKKNKYLIPDTKYQIPVYDDYAHHPTEIKATLSAFRQKYPQSKIICIFQPHQEKRLFALFKDFIKSFDDADNLILLDIYKVKGRDETLQDINSQKLVEAIKKRKLSPPVLYLKNPRSLKKIIENIIQNSKFPATAEPCQGGGKIQNSIIVMMGAGDIYKLTDILIK